VVGTKQADIRAILFDKDGTLVDFNRTWFRVCMALAQTAADGDRDKARLLLEAAGYDFTAERFRADSVIGAGTVEELVDLWHPGLSEEERASLIRSYDAHWVAEGSCRPIALDGLVENLEALAGQGYLLGVATNDSEAGAKGTADALGIGAMFASLLGYDSVARAKPHPDMLHHFAATHDLELRQIAMVGDNRHDLEMARAGGAGLAIGVLSGTGTAQTLTPLADIVLASISDLPAYFAGRTKRKFTEDEPA
jgi:phosphoglycolate phosphatase